MAIWNDDTKSDGARVQSFNSYVWNGFLFSQPDSAVKLANQLLTFSKEKGHLKGAAIANHHMGIATSIMGNDVRALDYFLESLRYNEELDDTSGISSCLNGIGILYQNLGDKEKALDYFSRSIELKEEVGEKHGMAATFLNIGNLFAGSDPEKASDYFLKSLKMAEETGNKMDIARALGNIGNVVRVPETYDQALDYYLRSSELFEEIGDEQGVINNLHNIGELYFVQGNFTAALDYCSRAFKRASAVGILWEQKLSCQCLYGTYKKMGKTSMALEYIEKLREIEDALSTQKAESSLQQMEFAKKLLADSINQVAKNQQIQLEHEAEIRRKNSFRNLVIISSVLLLLLVWGLYGRWKKAIAEKNLTDEKIDRVLQYEQLRKLDAIMEGQDMERKRISEDLHDKLGGKFNALSYTWSSVYANKLDSGTEKDEDLKALDDMIQSLSEEIRQVIQENVRSATSEFRLGESLEELRYLVQSSHQMELNILTNGIDLLERKVELELYKIILELVSNALKYSKGSHINIHLNKDNGHVILMVEDDGLGFDIAKVKSGMGLKNIRSRAERLGGVVEIDSRVGKGTTVILELDA